MAAKLIKIGRRVKGGGQVVTAEIDGVTLQVELDPKKFSAPVIEAINKETERRIKSIDEDPSPGTIKRRGPGKLFNVTGRLRVTSHEFVGGGWQVRIGRAIPRKLMNRLRAVAKVNLQSILKVPAVRQALEVDMRQAIVRIVPRKGGS